jgi:uncharacterized protein YjiS (DUF1127 family)
MSCGSSCCNSTKTIDAATSSPPSLRRSWNIPVAWLTRIAMWLKRRHQYRELLELDDRLLADIGLSKTTAVEARRSHLYMIAWRDSR